VIKANIPSRISFAVSSQIDSRTILDMAGAEKLLGRGDMLFYPLGQPKPLRVQGSFISDKEVDRIATHVKSLQGAEYDEEILQKIDNQTSETPKPDSSGDDELLPQAIVMVLELGQASASLIQRKFKVGYSRAARILDQMESWGVVSASDGSSKPRQILITRQEWDELNA
jgi:S-DNA-T family DNA segregation ATPase FtsK/SpoIIIE